MPMASLKPLRKTAERKAMRTSVMTTLTVVGLTPCSSPWTKGFSTTWAVASAADRVIVMMKSVATNPSRTRMNSLPFHHDSRCASIEIEPSPCGLSSATRR